jgi:mRNA interferase MazF
VLVPFPFSDLSQSRLRPAIVLADAGRGDWILCQITSNPYSDLHAIELTNTDFDRGSLRVTSYARPGKFFSANQSLIVSIFVRKGILMTLTLDPILEAAINEQARQQGIRPEALALNALREKFTVANLPLAGQDEWERLVLAVGTDCGVSLSHADLSSEGLYE